MARLSAYRIDTSVRTHGEWVELPGDPFVGVEVLSRGFTDAYTDAKNARLRKAANARGGDLNKVPTAVQREIIVECMIEHCLLDVRGLTNDDDSAVSFAQFCAALRDQPAYESLYIGVVNATASVGLARAEDVKDAAGN